MKSKGEYLFDRRERQLSLEYLVFLLVAGMMMAASLILLGSRDQKLAPGGGVLLGVLALLDLYAFDRFRNTPPTNGPRRRCAYTENGWNGRSSFGRGSAFPE